MSLTLNFLLALIQILITLKATVFRVGVHQLCEESFDCIYRWIRQWTGHFCGHFLIPHASGYRHLFSSSLTDLKLLTIHFDTS